MDRIVQGKPTTVRLANQVGFCDMKRVQKFAEPGNKIITFFKGLVRNAFARLADDIDGIDAILLAEIRNVSRTTW